MFHRLHCDPETHFLPGIPPGKIVDCTRIDGSLCDNLQPTPTEEGYPTCLRNLRRNGRQQCGRNLYKAGRRENLSGSIAGAGQGFSYCSQSRNRSPCDGHKGKVQPRGRNSVHDQVRGYLHLSIGLPAVVSATPSKVAKKAHKNVSNIKDR